MNAVSLMERLRHDASDQPYTERHEAADVIHALLDALERITTIDIGGNRAFEAAQNIAHAALAEAAQ